MKALGALILCASLVGCTQVAIAPANTPELLDGRLLFGETVQAAEPVDMLALDDEMRAYVKAKVGDARHSRVKLNNLIEGMIDDGLLTLEYDLNLTHPALTTFHRRQGNCLSFSVLFAALARQAGLKAVFQMVDIPPSFTSEGELVALNNHINVVVRGVRSGTLYTRDHVVDFNTSEYSGNYDTKRVDDDHVIALFHSNLAVEAMGAGDDRMAFAHLKYAINRSAEIADLWVNLGSLYSRHGETGAAISAFNHALSLEPSNKPALANLARVHDRIGDPETAARYRGQIEYYLQRNPYYHYHLARRAYAAEAYAESIARLETAIKFKPDEHQFYSLRGLNHLALGNDGLAVEDFENAKHLATRPLIVERYAHKLHLLTGANQEED